MMSDEEDSESRRSHFSFPSIMRSEKEANKKRKKKGKVATPTTDDFKVDVSDKRFEALFESHLYAPDPSAPQYKWVWFCGCGLVVMATCFAGPLRAWLISWQRGSSGRGRRRGSKTPPQDNHCLTGKGAGQSMQG